jgi:SAM-dependent methyltransferase
MLTVAYRTLDVKRGDVVLDLGCGQGRHTYEALRRGAHVVGVDLDPKVLPDVRAMCAGMAIEGEADPRQMAAFARGDATRLPFADSSFDKIIVSEVLEHIPTDESAMAEIARILKPGGVAAVSVPRFWPERVCWALSEDYHSNEGGHVRIYTRSELVSKLTRAGLEPVNLHHAHALHSPYWWIKCAVGVEKKNAVLPRMYQRFLEWQITAGPRPVDLLERALNPVLGKSLVVYLMKPKATA